jgi:large-conductance mechanosensitive channel
MDAIRVSIRPVLLLLFLVIISDAVYAVPLEVYRERVDKAVSELEAITSMPKDDEDQLINAIGSAIYLIRDVLPPKDTVEWNGRSIEVDNAWLEESLKQYEKEPLESARTSPVLMHMIDRLNALSEHITELENAKKVSSKDSDKERMQAILARIKQQEIDEKNTAKARLMAWIQEQLIKFLQWLEKFIPNGPKPSRALQSNTGSFIGRIIVYALILALIIFLIWKLIPLIRNRQKIPKATRREAVVILGEHVDADKTAKDLIHEAEELARAGDTRAAIRKAYIAILCELHDRQLLQLAQHLTNRDYLNALRQRVKLHNEMDLLTRSFERHWYGIQPASTEDWESFRSHYYQALSII